MKLESCAFPKCNLTGLQKHHITYVTKKSGLEPHIEMICGYHHDRITAIYQLKSTYSGELDNDRREGLWKEFISGKLIAVNFAESKKIKFSNGEPRMSEARHHEFIIVSKSKNDFYVEGYGNGLKWESCPICGGKL